MDCLTLYKLALSRLRESGIPDPEFESSLLLAEILDVPRSSVLLNLHPCTVEVVDRFESCITRRCQHEPFAYITGSQEFWSLDFMVTPDVLIPRPETELIIENVLHIFTDQKSGGRILDCGTGSGILPVTLATLYPDMVFTALDISAAALNVAIKNSIHHHCADRISFIQADFMAGLPLCCQYDAIVSNPPYVAAASFPALEEDVVGYEPHIALDGKGDGFVLVEHLLRSLAAYLKPGGHLFMEIGYDQEQRAVDVLRSLENYGQYKVIPDYAGLPRLVHAVKH